jgi:hypothetical protein
MRTNLAVIAVALLSACGETTDSTNVTTDGIYAQLSATAIGNGTTLLRATLKVGGSSSNTTIELDDGEKLVATGGAETKDMTEQDGISTTSYQAIFQTEAVDTAFKIDFQRVEDLVDAPNSTVTLPAPFVIATPAASATFSRASDPITVSWNTAAQDSMGIQISGACISPYSTAVPANATQHLIAAGTLQVLQPPPAPQSCEVTIDVARSRAGQVDPAYGEGGSFSASQARQVRVNSAP